MTWFQRDVQKREFDSTGQYRSITYSFSNPSSSGQTLVVAAQGGSLKILVLQCFVMASAALSLKFQSAGNDISGTFPIAANGGFVLPYSRHGWFQTNANEALNVNLSAGAQCSVQIIWVPTL